MSPLSNNQKKLLLDYCLDLTSEKEKSEAQLLISTNEEAAEIYTGIKSSLKPLDSIEPQKCPDDLVESTISILNKHKHVSQHQLEQLLAVEQTKKVPVRIGFWGNLVEMAAVAASIMLIVGARQKHLQNKCSTQLASFFQGLKSYISDHDDNSPSVATTAGAPWWKVGDQGPENQSNTRRIYLLVREKYVDPGIFICPGNKIGGNLKIEPSKIQDYKDFPDRRYVTYSFQITCRTGQSGKLLCRKVIMADLNPLFEKLPNFDSPLRIRLDKELLTINSSGHNRRGQNVLFGDGRVEFLKTRHTSDAHDDIFTLQNTDVYHGVEVPSCETDFFLAP